MKKEIKLYEIIFYDYHDKESYKTEIYAENINKAWANFKELRPNMALGFELIKTQKQIKNNKEYERALYKRKTLCGIKFECLICQK